MLYSVGFAVAFSFARGFHRVVRCHPPCSEMFKWELMQILKGEAFV